MAGQSIKASSHENRQPDHRWYHHQDFADCKKQRSSAICQRACPCHPVRHQKVFLTPDWDVFEVQYQTVSRWIDDWERSDTQGLHKRHDGGAQPIFDETETLRLLELVAEEPRRLTYVQTKLERETGKKASLSTLQRLIKKNGAGL